MTSASGAATTISDLGEFGLIAAVTAGRSDAPQVLIGPGDDAAQVATPGGSILISTDTLVSGRHFRFDWSSAYDVGRRAAAANLADIAAMGGVATALTIGFAAPGDLESQWAVELSQGIADEAALVGAHIVGGDVTAADEVMVCITVIGRAGEQVVRRNGASPGEVVGLRGRIGWAAAGLAVLGRGFRSPRVVVEAHRRPEPPYDAGPQAATAGATSMIDVSDGLIADLGHVAESSGVAIDIASEAFEVAEPLVSVGAAIGVDPRSFMLTGGDDHPLAATFPADAELPEGWTAIGEVREGSGVTVDGEEYEAAAGHEHFR
ncbi:thiamine-phosphate kinase [Solicola gregarius]|uniref:Thiamine-monophosphate kinase n=1 Tax=Solicola gregarius TaxID=2908642 RepID=A0AA46YME7_9ACTN|nr:thiamine-phosphate kinase [Solicola gregarius]UYM05698.1 thiamine-phosphate kinase [Solicola gregarius]